MKTEQKAWSIADAKDGDVLSLSTVVDVELRKFRLNVYYHWYAHNKVA